MLDFFASIASGGLLGIVGSLGTGVLSYFTKKSEQSFELELEKAKRDTLIAVTEARSKAAIEIGELSAFQASFKNASIAISSETGKSTIFGSAVFAFVDFVRMLVRPTMVGVLTWMTYSIYTDMNALVVSYGVSVFSAGDAVRIIQQVVLLILSLTATAVGWYFGSRSVSKIFKTDK